MPAGHDLGKLPDSMKRQGTEHAVVRCAGVAIAALVMLLPGACLDKLADDCAITATCDGGRGGEGGGVDPDCVPSEIGGAVNDTCGVFVRSSGSDESGDGSKANPYASIGHAIENARGGSVYVCAEGFTEEVRLPNGTSLFGGLACDAGWVRDPVERTRLTSPPDTVPLFLQNGTKATRIEDFRVTAPNAVVEGGSSIAVIANVTTASFTSCEIVANAGMRGAAGAVAPTPDEADLHGENGAPGIVMNGDGTACSSNTVGLAGGAGGMKVCGGVDVSGGKGGDGTTGNGDSGEDGLPLMALDGQGGIGEVNPLDCEAGTEGLSATDGTSGAQATGPGTISEQGYVGVSGNDGAVGPHGQGGGGGGGGAGCGGAAGRSGGGGGSGGCGGLPGGGGGPGGSSIAVLMIDSVISFTDSTLTARSGGVGGDGASGGLGGFGGVRGPKAPGDGPCEGGNGGDGGRGGSGSGGHGGHSLGVAHRGAPPTLAGTTITTGMGGEGGLGGASPLGAGGEAGVAESMLAFPE